jgi:sigma-B regulation protein RsbU (phosphoserine phosphatase)
MTKTNRCILLVDDEQNILNSLKRELGEWAKERSLEICVAISAEQGLEILKARHGDTVVVLSDLKMPSMKGSDFLLEVRKKYPDIVSILLTGFSETKEIVKAVQAGIFSYLMKPWETDYLLAEISKAYEYGETRRQNAQYLKTVEEELKWAGEMQKTLLRPNLPRSDGLEFRVSYQPVQGLYCGGDYYDVIFIGSNRYLMLIGDVEGHGVKAAFVTGILKAVIYPEYIRNVVGKSFSPAAFLGWLNERMNFEFRSTSNMIITFFAGVLDMNDYTFRYANAGHNHPFIIEGNKAVELPVSGSAIGFANSILYAEQSVPVSPGSIIDLYTDGLVEPGCIQDSGTVKIGPLLERVEYSRAYHKKIMESALAQAGCGSFTDDVTIVTARIL